MNILDQIFSIKYDDAIKIITILGIKIKFKDKNLEQKIYIEDLEKKYTQLIKEFEQLNWQVNNYIKYQENATVEFKNYINNWQCNFYKDIPLNYPIRLSNEEINLLIQYYKKSNQYLEFGSGGSTFLALINSNIKIYSVESDENWLNYLRSYSIVRKNEGERLEFYHINIGKVGKWGYPINSDMKDNYPNYSMSVFNKINSSDIDLVFIDGRFRVACALAVILNCSNDATMLIHDYTCRENYHVIEEFVDKIEIVDTLAVFKIKSNKKQSQIVL